MREREREREIQVVEKTVTNTFEKKVGQCLQKRWPNVFKICPMSSKKPSAAFVSSQMSSEKTTK